MTVKINLLPEAYQKDQGHKHLFHIGLVAGAIILAGELGAGLFLHARSRETRNLFLGARNAQTATTSVEKSIADITPEATLIIQQVTLASRLRITHRWSRLLASFAKITPDKVVLTLITSDPPIWSPALSTTINNLTSGKTDYKKDINPVIKSITLRGYAVDHQNLSEFVAVINASRLFAFIDLKEAQRDQYLGQEAVSFELQCHW